MQDVSYQHVTCYARSGMLARLFVVMEEIIGASLPIHTELCFVEIGLKCVCSKTKKYIKKRKN